jgi:competence protein ComEA
VVVVDVAGKVRRPGVLRLPVGSRVGDALRAAGGTKPGADTSGLNLARVLTDGEQVLVGEPPPAAAGTGSGSTPGGSAGPAAPAAPAAPLSLATATAEQLDQLPGVGPVLAAKIIDYRTEHGGFTAVSQLKEVSGIGDARYAELEKRVRP